VKAATNRARKREELISEGFTKEDSVLSIGSKVIDPDLDNWPSQRPSQSEGGNLETTEMSFI
jgi:hypothetical protein